MWLINSSFQYKLNLGTHKRIGTIVFRRVCSEDRCEDKGTGGPVPTAAVLG
jgi:hypothetical protein